MTTQSLIAYLAKHSVAATEKNGKLQVEAVYCLNGVASSQAEEIEPTFEAVRIWLGY